MKKIMSLFLLTLAGSASVQTFAQDNPDDKDLRLEVEPGLFFNGGRSLLAMYSPTANNNLGIGLYLMTTNIPDEISKNMLTNVTDSTNVSLSYEFALNVRYRFKLSKTYESNPYAGLILGWENIRLEKAGLQDLNISTFLVTPHVGYEFYVYKKMVYLNPQFRSVFYFGQNYSDATRLEKLNDYTFIPSLSVGLRL